MLTKEQAQKIRKDVLKVLGKGWRGRVSENLGWYVSWYNGAVNLHYNDLTPKKPFWAMVGDYGSLATGLLYLGDVHPPFKDPIASIKHACKVALQRFNEEVLPVMGSVAIIKNSYEEKKNGT